MATLINQGTLFFTPDDGVQQSLMTNITETEVEVTYGLSVFHGVTPDTFAVGDTLSYTVVLQNTGSGTLYTPNVGITVTGGTLALVPDSVTAYLLTADDVTAVPVTVTVGEPFGFVIDTAIPVGALVYLNYRATVTAATGDLLVSTAIGGANAGSPTGPILTDSDTAIARRQTLQITKSAPEEASVGDTIAYRFFITNSGEESVTIDGLTDRLPAGFSFTGAALVVGGVIVPLVAGVDYTVTDEGLFTLTPSTRITLPAGSSAQLTITGVVTA
ncbi:MAG: DUF11 domain-containing protein [Clostridia bacterium]|nr:DUF11 domain-containing protein [Clostridia bacterium]